MAHDVEADKARAVQRAAGEVKAAETQETARRQAEAKQPSQAQKNDHAVQEQRLARDKAYYESGVPIAGHDWTAEHEQGHSRSR